MCTGPPSRTGTELSGSRVAAVAAAVVLLLAGAACGSGGEVAGGKPAPASGIGAGTLGKSVPIIEPSRDGPSDTVTVNAGDAQYTVPMIREGRVIQPVAATDKRILFSETARETTAPASPQVFELWDPATNTWTRAWDGEPGTQDIVSGSDGAWVTTVRTGMDLPFASWSLILRNVDTGETRQLATGDPELADTPGLQPDLPMGFAPLPSIANAKVTWNQLVATPEGVGKQVLLYDIASGDQREVASVADATREDLRLPSTSGGRVAWIHRDFETHSAAVFIDSESGPTKLSISGDPWSVALFDAGQRIAWDDGLQAKWVMSLDSGASRRYATNEGWGTVTNGQQLSWMPAGAQGGRGGYFDPEAGKLHLLSPAPGMLSNIATLLGPWFAWQEIPAGNPAAGHYLFARIEN